MVRLAALVAVVTTATLMVASTAWGNHIRGATYRGTHDGGGTVDFQVSSDGKRITRFKATSIQGNTCTVGAVESIFPGSSGPRIDRFHGFEGRADGGRSLDFGGAFLVKQRAKGTFFYDSGDDPFRPTCLSKVMNWTARTSASPAGSDECRSAKRFLRKARRALRRATTIRAKRKARGDLRSARREHGREC